MKFFDKGRTKLALNLKFDQLKDFDPDEILKQVPELQKLMDLREALKAEGFALVPRAGGRLLECRGEGGVPALQTVPDREGQVLALPLRLSFVEGRFYVLR